MVISQAVSSPTSTPPSQRHIAVRPAFSYQGFALLLKSAVNPAGHVDYAALHRNPRLLRRAVRDFAATSPENRPALFPAREDKLAYWINAYNLFVLDGVTRRWPTRSVRANGKDAFFTTQHFTAGGRRYTLNEIENDILRKIYNEPRIHFTINCGAVSCPVLRPAPYTGADIARRLDQAARLFINDSRNVAIDERTETVTLSEIFRWYEGDFLGWLRAQGETAPTILAYIDRYLDDPHARELLAEKRFQIAYAQYDWTLNADTLPIR
jgi:hypothetical protein